MYDIEEFLRDEEIESANGKIRCVLVKTWRVFNRTTNEIEKECRTRREAVDLKTFLNHPAR